MIGYAVINLDGLKDYSPEGRDWTKRHWADYFFCHQSEIPLQGRERVMDPLGSGDDMGSLLSLIRHLESTGQKLELYFSDSFAAVIGYNRHRFVVPASTVKCEPLKEYAELPGEELPVPGLLPTKAPSGSVASIRLERSEVEDALKSLEKEADAIRTCDSPQMADLKAELDALMERIRLKQTELLEEQEKEKKALAEKKKELEKRLFVLETNIYGIRCYLGEVTSFYTVRDGKSAPEETPVVIYQKVRFLDEELGKYVSLFGFGDGKDDKDQLLELLKYRDDIADILCPGPKSISAVKISRTGTVKALSRYVANMLQDYRMYHENQLAVLIRNGEQIHIAWLDAKKINISDDSIFYGNSDTESEPFEEGGYFQERTLQKEREKARREMLSRWFFFTILQGVIDNTSLISLPGKVSITGKDSPYVKFSLADGWLTEDRYGSFADMLKKSSHIPLAKGDTILTGAMLERDDPSSQYNVWNNNRGIGDRNRTYGLHLPGTEFIKVNKVIPSISVRLRLRLYRAYIEAEYAGDDTDPACRLVYTDEPAGEEEEIKVLKWYGYRGRTSYRKLTDADIKGLSYIREKELYCSSGRIMADNIWNEYSKDQLKDLYERKESLYYRKLESWAVAGERDHEYYVSIKQTYEEPGYNVNFRFYPDEVIPAVFLCSSWIRSVIRTGNTGNFWLCGAKMSYADMLPYLQKLLSHLQEREAAEKKLLEEAGGGSWIESHEDWDADLCEWRIMNRVHVLTPARAKKFIRTLSTLSGCRQSEDKKVSREG